MATQNRTCKVCGERYYYCPSCPGELRPSWYGMFHDENCKNIFQILRDKFLEKTSYAEAKALLKECDLSKMSSFNPAMQEQIRDVLKYRPVAVRHPNISKQEESDSETDIVNK